MPDEKPLERLKTGISRVRWCDPDNGRYSFKPAVMKEVMYSNKADPATEMCWFDELFHGGIVLPKQPDGKHRAVTLLITGPPGTGKSTLAMELVVRLAGREKPSDFSGRTLYVATEAYPNWMISNARSFGWLEQSKLGGESEDQVIQRLFAFGSQPSQAHISICTLEDIKTGVGHEYRVLRRMLSLDPQEDRLNAGPQDADKFDMVVIDSLNSVQTDKRKGFAELYNRFVEGGPRLVIFVLDSSPKLPVAETWEFIADIVIRLDRDDHIGYTVRTLEVVKARYQAHVWGKQQLKIPEPPKSESNHIASPSVVERERRMRAHPWAEGGIFIFPSIHYILSRYKREAPFDPGTEPVPTPLASLNKLLGGGIPAGRTTALRGGRGTHKSHWGHLQALHNVLESKGGSIIISLRDDEAMTKHALAGIIRDHWKEHAAAATKKLDALLAEGRLEILYYPPGYITPEEFFHRMLLSIYRMRAANEARKVSERAAKDGKSGGSGLEQEVHSYGITLLFNSLDQIASRFPLCAKEEVFIPGIIQTLSSIGVTSVFVGADTEGIDKSLKDLLSMAELVLRARRKKNPKKERLKEILARTISERRQGLSNSNLDSLIDALPKDLTITELTVERYAGGKPAGSQGMLELVTDKSLFKSILNPGLQFIPYLDSDAVPGVAGRKAKGKA
jgi:KaiC/GvpD/RAD55 family RecA-like ATPase